MAKKLAVDNIRFLAFQMIEGVAYLHSRKVVHQNLKPENIVINWRSQLRICNFGSAMNINNDVRPWPKVEEIDPVSLRYTAPEVSTKEKVIVNLQTIFCAITWIKYQTFNSISNKLAIFSNQELSTAMDMWSIGCIVAELILRRPLFPITNHSSHLTIIKTVIGHGYRKYWTRCYPKIEDIYDLPDFLSQLIAFDPDERLVKFNYFCIHKI